MRYKHGLLASPFLVLLVSLFWDTSAGRAPFETVLGITDGGVKVYSCNYDTANKTLYNTTESLNAYYKGIYTGMKYQCVELARRYWLINYGVVFASVPMAYDIFPLKVAQRVADGQQLPLTRHPNGATVRPEKGSLLIWRPLGEYNITGHVAVVVTVTDTSIDIVEQNVLDEVWPRGQLFSRRLKTKVENLGGYWIQCTYSDAEILGWVTIQRSIEETENPFEEAEQES